MGAKQNFKPKELNMAIYEMIPTTMLSKKNELVTPSESLPELVHLNDAAKSVYIDFARILPATTTPQASIDNAIHEMKLRHQHMLLVEENGQVVGLIGFEDILSEKPIRLMQEKRLSRSEITVEMLMKPRDKILVIDYVQLKNAQVGHILKTIKEHSARYILVVKQLKKDSHLIKGLFSASQIGKQLHSDLSSIVTKAPETIVELHKERKF